MSKWVGIIVGIVVVISAGAGYFFFSQARNSRNTATSPSTTEQGASDTKTTKSNAKNNVFARNFSQGKCQGSGTVEFTHSPMDIADIGIIQPYGIMVGAHVVPTDHGYYSPIVFRSERDKYPVYAIADGFIVNISHRGQAVGDNQDPSHVTDEYQMQFEHSCTFYSYYDLLTSLSPELKQAVGELKGFESKPVRIPVKAGQLVGRVGGQTVDFAVWNFEKSPDFVVNTASYKDQESRFYLDDMFKYFVEPVHAQLLAKSARVVPPITGKINYDVAGKLVGNWFKEGSGGFNGPPGIQNQAGGRYWDGHLAIAYDYIDPTAIKLSVGNWPSGASQFMVKGNAPDPATVSVDSGLIKYELVQGGYVNGDTGAGWMLDTVIANPKIQAGGQVQGTALLQMTAPDTLKLELFPGKTAAAVSQFTAAALVYKR